MKGYSFIFLLFLVLELRYSTCKNLYKDGLDHSDLRDSPKSNNEQNGLTVCEFDISSTISSRYAKTLVTSKVHNPDKNAKEANFNVILPEKAFISEFFIEIKGNKYTAHVKDKGEVSETYSNDVDADVKNGSRIKISSWENTQFTARVNVEAGENATFHLTYEELLERNNYQYEHVLYISPGQYIDRINVQVTIHENQPLKFVRTPPLRSWYGNTETEHKLDPSSDIQKINSTSTVIKFNPDINNQKKLNKELGGSENVGLSGYFIVQYDVERDASHEVLLREGFFVDFVRSEKPNQEKSVEHDIQDIYSTVNNFAKNVVHIKEVARTTVPRQTRSNELVTVGKYDEDSSKKDQVHEGNNDSASGNQYIDSPLDRIWAFVTIKQKLKELKLDGDNSQLKKDILNLALKYSFVIDMTSLEMQEVTEAYKCTGQICTTPLPFGPTRKVYGEGYAAAGLFPYKCTGQICTTPFPFRPRPQPSSSAGNYEPNIRILIKKTNSTLYLSQD